MSTTPTTFVSDLDGTLLNSAAGVSEFTRRVVNSIASTHTVVLATGRPPRLVAEFAETFPTIESVICANGAFHLNPTTGALTQVGAISDDHALEIVRRVRQVNPSASFAVETIVGHRREAQYASDYQVPKHLIGSIEEIVQGGVAKVLIQLEDRVSRAEASRLAALIDELGVLTVSNPTFYEVAPAGVSKASGVAALDLVGETIAYGDMPNDITLLRWADVGVAVANADEEVRAAASCVLELTNDQDGVAHHMLKLLGLSLP